MFFGTVEFLILKSTLTAAKTGIFNYHKVRIRYIKRMYTEVLRRPNLSEIIPTTVVKSYYLLYGFSNFVCEFVLAEHNLECFNSIFIYTNIQVRTLKVETLHTCIRFNIWFFMFEKNLE